MIEKEQLPKMGNVVGSVKKPFDIDALVEFIKKIILLDFVRLAKVNKYLLNITTPITLIKSTSLSHFL